MILILSISFIVIMYGCSLLITYTGLVYKALATLGAGTPRIIIYCIKQCYFDGEISIKSLRNIYIKSFIMSHIRWLVYITCIPSLYPYIENFAYFTFTLFPGTVAFILYLANCISLNTGFFCTISNISPPSPSFVMQLSVMTYDINFGFEKLSRILVNFDKQFDKAFLSRNPEDIALARHYRSQMITLRETLVSQLSERKSLTARAYAFHRNPYLNCFGKTDREHQSVLNVTYTYIHVEN